jgi:hypothetical protein
MVSVVVMVAMKIVGCLNKRWRNGRLSYAFERLLSADIAYRGRTNAVIMPAAKSLSGQAYGV